MSNVLKLRLHDLDIIEPLTENQAKCFKAFENDKNLIMIGSAGTGKTYLGLYLALEAVLEPKNHYKKVVVVRSIVPTREIGFLPGNEEEKKDAYTGPYRGITAELFNDPEAWPKLVSAGTVKFLSTSFIRGVTLKNSIVVIDECQNLNFHEIDSVITRLGENCRVIFAGDYYQSDFDKDKEKNGILRFLTIAEQMRDFRIVEFKWEDIVRSGFVRDYIMTKEMLGIRE